MPPKTTFNTEQEFYGGVMQAMDGVVERQREYNAELLAVVEPLVARQKRRKLFEQFGEALDGADSSPSGAAGRSLQRDCQAIVADPEKALWLRAVAKKLCRASAASITDAEAAVVRALTTGDSGLGQAVAVWEPLADDVYSLLLRYGAFRTLGVVSLATGKTKLASVTGKATSYWYQASSQGTAITADATITGESISPECATLGALVEVSGEALADGKVTFEGALLQAIVEGLSYRLDFAALQSDGSADTTDGEMVGIFAHPSVPVVDAGAGITSIASLTFDDFANTIGGVTPSALQNPCRWWLAPDFMPSLLKIHDGSERLLKPPTGPADEWRILGFPVTWAAAAPNTNAASAKVAAFGRGDAYSVALRQDFEVMSSQGAKFAYNIWQFRAIARARCLLRDATSLAILKLAAV